MGKEGYLGEPELPPCCVPHKKMPHTVDVRLDHRPVRPVHRYPLQSAIFSFDLSTLFLGPRGPLIEPSISVPSTRPARIFPEFIDELKHCRQASGTPQIIYFLKANDVSYPNSEENSNTYRDKYKEKYRDKYKYRDK